MACKYFLDGQHALCAVVQGLMTPSLSEMYAYCANNDPSRCPLYQRYEATGEKVPLEADL